MNPKIIAEFLAEECGYEFSISSYPENHRAHDLLEEKNVNPFYVGDDETLDLWGRQQSDAIIDYFIHVPQIDERYDSLWDESSGCIIRYTKGAVYRIWINERIEWCLEQIGWIQC